MWESRETAHSEVLGIGESEGGDGECGRRDHTEFGQRQPPGDEHHGDENRERDVSGQHTDADTTDVGRSEEHTSELQSQSNLVCRLLLEKKKTNKNTT